MRNRLLRSKYTTSETYIAKYNQNRTMFMLTLRSGNCQRRT